MPTSPEVTVTPALPDQKPPLSALSQLYLHDLSDLGEWELDETGRYGYDALAGCWPPSGEWEVRPYPGYAPAAAFWATVCAELAVDGVRTGPIPGHTMPNARVLAFSTKPAG